jgi:Zn-finger nucleic acid-binding protein
MNCPKCNATLREREREITAGEVVVMDICPSCGGIWLDKGELEKLTRLEDRYYDRPQRGNNDRWDDDDDDDDDSPFGSFGRGGGQGQGGRRNSFLGGLFDSFGN